MAIKQLMTVEDLAQLSDECRYDLIRGELVTMTPAGFGHGNFALAIGADLKQYQRSSGLGRAVGAETGFILARDPDVMLAPDAAFVLHDRLPSRDEWGPFLELAPDLAVEVISPGDRARYVADKVMEYLDAGVRLVWLIDPIRETVTVYSSDRTARILTITDELDGGDVLPGFSVPVAQIFE